MKLEKIYKIEGQIKILTGLHIGGSKDNIEIGGMDQPIIKEPISEAPYIPGSSLKGKMRSMLETVYFPESVKNGKPSTESNEVTKIFGIAGDTKSQEMGTTRIVVRDAFLSDKTPSPEKSWQARFQSGDLTLEEKYEVSIDRIQGTALRGALRPVERVPAGVVFDFAISLKQMEQDDPNMIEWIWRGLKLIELDGLGGNISRGSGQVRFINVTKDGDPQDIILEQIGDKLWETVS